MDRTEPREDFLTALRRQLTADAIQHVIVPRVIGRRQTEKSDPGLRLSLCIAGERTHLHRGQVKPSEMTWSAGTAAIEPPGVVFDTEYRRAGHSRTLGVIMKPDVVRVLDVVCDAAPEDLPVRAGTPRFVSEIPRRFLPAAAWHCICALRECDGHEDERCRVRLLLNILEDVVSLVEQHHEDESVLPDTFLLAREYVKEHFQAPITRGRVAQTLRVHPNHISRLFQEHAGCSFTEFLNKLRLHRAAELLQDPQLSVKEVIYASGFSNDTQFYRGFRARFGLSPRKYREQSIEEHHEETGP